jgi:hypothetical protein
VKATVMVEAGICGFKTTCDATADDDQHVQFAIESDCEKIHAFAAALNARGIVDALQEIDPRSESVVLATARECLKGCCAGCVVPVAVFKSMQVSAVLALPKDISIRFAER